MPLENFFVNYKVLVEARDIVRQEAIDESMKR
jgi:hypothetical protein